MPYDLFEHRHRFAMWAAARAAQRGLTSVPTLCAALCSTDLPSFVRENAADSITEDDFLRRHRVWCNAIVRHLKAAGIKSASYGRAAKLVAIYLKAMVVTGPHCDTQLARVAHPPIDRTILQALASLEGLPKSARTVFRTTNWTALDSHRYCELINLIKEHVPDVEPFWRLEQHFGSKFARAALVY